MKKVEAAGFKVDVVRCPDHGLHVLSVEPTRFEVYEPEAQESNGSVGWSRNYETGYSAIDWGN